MSKIKIAIVGVGNCVSSLVQGIHYYTGDKLENPIGLMHREIGDYNPGDIEVVTAFDNNARKVGRDLHEAIFADPNCSTVFCKHPPGQFTDDEAFHMMERLIIENDEPES